MQTFLATLRRSAGLICAGAMLAAPSIRAAANDTPGQADAFPDFESYIKISGQTPFITGDTAAYASRAGTPSSGAAGIEDLYYTRDLNDTTTLTVNGRALAGTDDYLADFKVEKDKLGSIDAGYSRFRTFYDGVGGFFPQSDTFYRFSPESLHVDRSKGWVDLKLALPNRPVFTFSYKNEARTGMKDSTEWGAVINPLAVVTKGALVGTALPVNTPYIAPNAITMDEHHSSFTAGMDATWGSTTETLRLIDDHVNNSDGKGYVRYPITNVTADPTVVVTDDVETRVSNSFKLINETETKLNDRWTFNTGFSYLHLTSTDGGTWITPSYNATANGVYNTQTASNIYGSSKFDDYAATFSFDYKPAKDWLIKMAYRQEYDVTGSSGGFQTTALASTAKTISSQYVTTSEDVTYSRYFERVETPELEIQWQALKNLMFYGSADDRINQDNQHWINPYAAVATWGTGVVTNSGAPIGSVFFQEADQTYQTAKLGANWNPTSFLTFRAEVFRKSDQNQFAGANNIVGTASYGALYENGFTLTGIKLTLVLKPTSTLSFTTRYQPQSGTMSVFGNPVNGGDGVHDVTSGKVKGEMISEMVNWTPNQTVYLQGTVNLVYNTLQTSDPYVVVSTNPYVPPPFINSDNNYVTGNGLCGFVVDKADDLQLRVTYTKANDYNPQIATGGMPYGAGFLEESATATLKHKFSDKLLGELRAGYLRRTDDTTGGFTNYRGPLVYASLTYAL